MDSGLTETFVYFDFDTKSGNTIIPNKKSNEEFSRYKNQKGDKTIFYGGIKVDIKNRTTYLFKRNH